jgi:hypothetical protein
MSVQGMSAVVKVPLKARFVNAFGAFTDPGVRLQTYLSFEQRRGTRFCIL